MAVCPQCKSEQTRRKDGCCPSCKTPISVYGGYWYRTADGAPTEAVVRKFEKLVSQRMTAERNMPIPFNFPRRSARFQRELVRAEVMLKEADGDLYLVCEALDILFTDQKFSFKTRASLMDTYRDYPLAVAVAEAKRILAEQTAAAEAFFTTSLLQKENIFLSE